MGSNHIGMGGPDLSEKMMLKPQPEREARVSQAKGRGKLIPEGKTQHGELHEARLSAESPCGQRGVTRQRAVGKGSGEDGRGQGP